MHLYVRVVVYASFPFKLKKNGVFLQILDNFPLFLDDNESNLKSSIGKSPKVHKDAWKRMLKSGSRYESRKIQSIDFYDRTNLFWR